MAVTHIVPDLGTSSLARATSFYVDVLGLEVVMDHGWIVIRPDPTRPEVQLSLMTHDATASSSGIRAGTWRTSSDRSWATT